MNREEIEQWLDTKVQNSSYEFNILKAIEELGELITALSQRVTKEGKVGELELVEEIADVEIQLYCIKKLFDIDSVYVNIVKTQKILKKIENESSFKIN